MKKNNSNKYKHKNNDDSRNSLLLKYIKKSPKEVWVRLIEIYAKEETDQYSTIDCIIISTVGHEKSCIRGTDSMERWMGKHRVNWDHM